MRSLTSCHVPVPRLTGLTVTEDTRLPGPEELEDPEAFLSFVTLTEAIL